MVDKNFEQPSWQEQQSQGREILARQTAEIEEAKIADEQKRADELRAQQEAAAAVNLQQERERERLTASMVYEQQAGGPGASQGSTASPTAEIDAKIAKLHKAASNDYAIPYIFLTTGAATVDILQAVCDFSVVLSLLASGLGVGFSVIRHYTLRYANPGASKKEHDAMLNRTIISGAISMIPFVDILPEQTAVMIREWTVKRLAIIEANKELTKLKAQRQKMMY